MPQVRHTLQPHHKIPCLQRDKSTNLLDASDLDDFYNTVMVKESDLSWISYNFLPATGLSVRAGLELSFCAALVQPERRIYHNEDSLESRIL